METRTEFVPVSSGASLATLVILPGSGSYPAVIVRTLYGRNNLPGLGSFLSSHGYATVIQDVRGSGESSGDFKFLAQEPDDAVETARWVLAQPWCDGRLAVLGISYLSAASIAIAAEFPGQVKAAIWVTAPVRKDILCFQGGALRLHHTLPWVYMRQAPLGCFDPGTLYRKLPLIDAIPQDLNPSWQAMLEEGPRSKFWEENDLWRYVQKVRVPGLHFGGWFDFLLDATLVPYFEMIRSGVPQRLILGPWSHNGIVGTEKISGDISYGYWGKECGEAGPGEERAMAESRDRSDGSGLKGNQGLELPADMVDTSSHFVEESIRWLDFWVKGIDADTRGFANGPSRVSYPSGGSSQTGDFQGDFRLRSSVKCFFTGHQPHWEEFDSWPRPNAGVLRLYLGARGSLDTVSHPAVGFPGSGVLSADMAFIENRPATSDSFIYDPENPVPTEGGAVWAFSKAGLIPGPSVSSIHLRDDVLTYDSEPLDSPLKIFGVPEVELYASSSAPDTDFVAMLLDVDEEDVARYVSDGIVRARYRNGLDREDFLVPGETYLFRIILKGCAHTFGPGHRVRLLITSSNFPKFDRNPNTGEPIYRSRGMQKAVQTVRYGRAAPSALVIGTF